MVLLCSTSEVYSLFNKSIQILSKILNLKFPPASNLTQAKCRKFPGKQRIQTIKSIGFSSGTSETTRLWCRNAQNAPRVAQQEHPTNIPRMMRTLPKPRVSGQQSVLVPVVDDRVMIGCHWTVMIIGIWCFCGWCCFFAGCMMIGLSTSETC